MLKDEFKTMLKESLQIVYRNHPEVGAFHYRTRSNDVVTFARLSYPFNGFFDGLIDDFVVPCGDDGAVTLREALEWIDEIDG